MASSRNKSSSCLHHRSSPDLYPFYSPASSSTFASSSTSTFSSRSTMFSRASSPTRVSMYASSSSSPSVRFSFDRPISPGRSIAVTNQSNAAVPSRQKKTCMCSPTNHPGSFRCALHKGMASHPHHHPVSYQARSLNFRRSAMTNSLVRIGGVEGDLVRRALSALIRPSSHQQRRRTSFQPRPSRLSRMSTAEDS